MSSILIGVSAGQILKFHKITPKQKQNITQISSIEFHDKIISFVHVKVENGIFVLLQDSTLWKVKLPGLTTLKIASNVSCLASLNKKHELAYGTLSGQIFILKKSQENLVYSTSSNKLLPIQLLASSADDSHLVFATENSSIIYCLSLTSNTLFEISLNSSQSSCLKHLDLSCFKQSLLACGYDDGSVYLIDIFTKTVLKEFKNVHLSPVSCIKFSPFNRYLMVSVSLDKRYILYDVEKQKVVRSLATAHPLSSLSIHSNGVILAMGSLDGYFQLFDLASGGKSPIVSLNIGTFSVQDVAFLNVIEKSLEKIVNVQEEELKENEKLYEKKMNCVADQSVNYMDLFSPVGSSKIKKVDPLLAVKKPPLFKKHDIITEEVSDSIPEKEKFENNNGDKVETRNETPTVSEEVVLTPKTPVSTIQKKVSFAPSPILTPIQEKRDSAICTNLLESTEDKFAKLQGSLVDKISTALSCPSSNSSLYKTEPEAPISEPSPPLHSRNPELKPLHPETTYPETNNEFSRTLLSNIISDCLDTFKSEIRSDIQNMHIEMVHQFDIQQRIMEEKIAESSKVIIKSLVPVLCQNAHAFMLDYGLNGKDKDEEEGSMLN